MKKFKYAKDCLEIIDYYVGINHLKRLLQYISFKELSNIEDIEIFSKTIDNGVQWPMGENWNSFTIDLEEVSIKTKALIQDDCFSFAFDIIAPDKTYKSIYWASYDVDEDIVIELDDGFEYIDLVSAEEINYLIELIAKCIHDKYNIDYDMLYNDYIEDDEDED